VKEAAAAAKEVAAAAKKAHTNVTFLLHNNSEILFKILQTPA
jgi:hypothetical protein